MERINRSHKKRDLDAHVLGTAKAVEKGAENSPVGDINWDVHKAEVHSDIALADDQGGGRPIILRQFDYALQPGRPKPTPEEILTPGYLKFLESQLYFVDELDLVQTPKVVISDTGFKIFATCQARKGSILPYHQKPQTLTELITKK